MKRKLQYFGGAFTMVFGLMLGLVVSGQVKVSLPTATAAGCEVRAEVAEGIGGTPMYDPYAGVTKKFVKKDGKAYIRVVVTGNGCTQPVSLVAWKAESLSGKPYKSQVILDSKSVTIAGGDSKTMNVQIPDCFFQIDLVRGLNPEGIDGGGAYQDGRMIHSVHGGTKTCFPPTPPPPTPNPVATCVAIAKNQISRTEFNFTGTASASGGATISSYLFTVTNAAGQVVGTRNVPSTATTAQSGNMTFNTPGNYIARLIVTTSVGAKTSQTCATTFTVTPPPTESDPGVEVDKKVLNKHGVAQEQVTVGLNQEFTYQIVVRNTGNVALQNVAVSDVQPNGVTFISASAGTIANNSWNYTIPSLAVDESKTYTLKAKVPTYLAGKIKNTVCVDAPAVPGSPDDCDDAYIEVPQPYAACVSLRTKYTDRTHFQLTGRAIARNTATISAYVFVIKNKAGEVVKTVTVNSDQLTATTDQLELGPGEYSATLNVKTSVGDKTSANCNSKVLIPEPNKVQVCDPATKQIIIVDEEDADKYKPVNDPACQPAEPETVQVCDPSTGEIITVEKGHEGSYKPVGDAACKDTPSTPETPVTPSTPTPAALVDTGATEVVGLFMAVAAAGVMAHRLVWVRFGN